MIEGEYKEMILTINQDGAENKWAAYPQLPDFGQLYQAGRVLMVISRTSISSRIIEFRPVKPSEVERLSLLLVNHIEKENPK